LQPADETQKLILKYFYSWQEPLNINEFRECLDENVLFDAGNMKMEGSDKLADMIKSTESPWKDVTLLESMVQENQGIIFYEGIDKKTGSKMRVAEHITIANGRIAKIIAAICPL
jgi:hypothetical protein